MMQSGESLLSSLASMGRAKRRALLARFDPSMLNALLYDWQGIWARPNQLLPIGNWRIGLWLAGRGFGKTRVGAEGVRAVVEAGTHGHIAIVAPTAADARDVMVEGVSGIMAVSPPWFRPQYEPSKRRLTWPNGAVAITYSADEPERLRGANSDFFWVDELRSWRYAQEAWDMLMLGFRLGANPQGLVTTTPGPNRSCSERPAAGTQPPRLSEALPMRTGPISRPAFYEEVIRKYEGTRLGRQELAAEVLDDVEGALWTLANLDETRVLVAPRELTRIVVGVDPSGGSDGEADEQGIVVAGKGTNGELYILADRSCRMTPDGWGRRAVQASLDFKADRIVFERNFGGDMVEHVLRTAAGAMGVHIVTEAVTASRGKQVRAEPIAALWEQKRAHLVGSMPELEDQLLWFTPEGMQASPDRADAMVWCATELMLGPSAPSYKGIPEVVTSWSNRGRPQEILFQRYRR